MPVSKHVESTGPELNFCILHHYLLGMKIKDSDLDLPVVLVPLGVKMHYLSSLIC